MPSRFASLGLVLCTALSSLAVLSCGAGGAAKAVRPDQPNAKDALGSAACVAPGDDAEPWVIDLKADNRGALKAAMDRGVVVVSYDCKDLKILRGCQVEGGYAYAGTGFNEDIMRLEDSDSVRATLSGGAALAAKLEADMQRGTKLDIAYAVVGERNTTLPAISKDRLRGECKGATHFVATASLGAFAMRSSTDAKVAAAAEIFGQGASSSSASSASLNSSSGKRDVCEKAGSSDAQPLADCDIPLKIRLVAVGERASAGGRSVRTPASCPGGTVRQGNACVSAKRATAAVCKPGEPSACEASCKAGDGTSCALAGYAYEKGKGVSEDSKRAMELYEQACAKKNLDGCTGVGFLFSKGEGVAQDKGRAATIFKEACGKGNGRACSGIGHQMRLSGDTAGATEMFERACNLAYTRACFYAGAMLMKSGKDAARAFRNHKAACTGEDMRGCLAASGMLQSGTGVAANASEASALRERASKALEAACSSRDFEACESLGDFYMGEYDKASKKPEKAIAFYNTACGGGWDNACLEAARILERGDAPVPKNPQTAKQYYEYACVRGGIAEACTKSGKKPMQQQAAAQPAQPKTTTTTSKPGAGFLKRGR